MSTGILYHGFGIHGYRYTKTEYQQSALVFSIEKEATYLRCPCCKGIQVTRKGKVLRWFHTLPIGRKQVYRKLRIPRVFCRTCGIIRQIKLGFADARRTCTRAFQRYAMELSKRCSAPARMATGRPWTLPVSEVFPTSRRWYREMDTQHHQESAEQIPSALPLLKFCLAHFLTIFFRLFLAYLLLIKRNAMLNTDAGIVSGF